MQLIWPGETWAHYFLLTLVLASDEVDSIKYLNIRTTVTGLRIVLEQGCPIFLLVRATFTGEKLLRAKCIFTKIQLQIIASLLYKNWCSLWPVFWVSFPKISDDKKKVFAANRCWFLSVFWVSVPKSKWRPKKKVFAPNQIWFRENQTEEGFGLDLFICQKMLSKPFHEEINRAKRSCGPQKTASRAKCGPWATGWAALCWSILCPIITKQQSSLKHYVRKLTLKDTLTIVSSQLLQKWYLHKT